MPSEFTACSDSLSGLCFLHFYHSLVRELELTWADSTFGENSSIDVAFKRR